MRKQLFDAAAGLDKKIALVLKRWPMMLKVFVVFVLDLFAADMDYKGNQAAGFSLLGISLLICMTVLPSPSKENGKCRKQSKR